MACELPRRAWRAGITAGRVGFAIAGAAALLGAVLLDPDLLATTLFAVAFLLLGLGFGVPVATAAEVGHPVGNLLAALTDRRQAMAGRLKDRLLESLEGAAITVTLDGARARALAEQAIVRSVARWRGPVGPELDVYLLCCTVRLAVRDAWGDPAIGEGDPGAPLTRLSRRDRAIWALRGWDLADAEIARMLDCSVEEVAGAATPLAGEQR